jgi:uncharacterized protein YecE (DUF72 family)
MKPVRIGCSGWNYRDWRERVYPKGMGPSRWLAHYATLFDTVEVNSTFYRLPKAEAVNRWAEQTPEDFVFSPKASRYLTHIKRLTQPKDGVVRFYEPLQALVEAGKMGPVVWQLPPNFRRNDERLAGALERLPGGRHCFELRHESWFRDDVYALLREHGAALVIGDTPERPFQAHEITADFTLIRFHYGHRGRRGNYSDRELDEWAERIREWRKSTDVYAYFNNDWEGIAVRNARGLRKRLDP